MTSSPSDEKKIMNKERRLYYERLDLVRCLRINNFNGADGHNHNAKGKHAIHGNSQPLMMCVAGILVRTNGITRNVRVPLSVHQSNWCHYQKENKAEKHSDVESL